MTDLDLPDLASPAAEATRPPAFETLWQRALRRRRARVVVTTAAVATAVAAIASASLVARDDPRSVEPVHTPSPTPSPTTAPVTAEQVVDEGVLYSVAADGDRLLTVWQRCDSDDVHCRYAWRLGGARPVVGLSTSREGLGVTAAGGGRFLLIDAGPRGTELVVERDGTTRPVVDGPLQPRAGLAVVRAGKAGPALLDPATGQRSAFTRPPGVAGWDGAAIDGDGVIWATAMTEQTDVRSISEVGLWHSRDGRRWTRRALTVGRPNSPGYVVASGDHVAALATYDGATVLPVGDLAVTADGGLHWHDLARDDVPFEYVDTMAATSGGTLFVLGGDLEGGAVSLYRTTDDAWTHFAKVAAPLGQGGVLPAGRDVLVQLGSSTDPALASIDDDGHVTRWTSPLR